MDANAEQVKPAGSRLSSWRSVIIGMLLFAFLPLAHAAIRFDVFLGYDGYIPEGSWFPVVCEIANDGPSFHGVVKISPGQYNQGQDRRMALELPTGTTKRFVIPVFSPGRMGAYSAWDAQLLDERGRVRAESLGMRARKTFNWRVPLMAAVAKSTVPLPNLRPQGQNPPDYQPQVARLQPNLFPDNPIALEGLTSIYLNAERALELKVPQVNALVSWLYGGGHLVVGVEQTLHVNGNEWLRQLLPCALSGMTNKTEHPELQDWLSSPVMNNGLDYPYFTTVVTPTVIPPPVAGTNRPGTRPAPRPPTARPRSTGPQNLANPYAVLTPETMFEQAPIQLATGTIRDGTVLIGSSESPLALFARRGRGQITVLLFSPELEPVLSWKNRAWFWAKILGMPPELFTLNRLGYSGESIDAVLGTMIETKQVRKLPVGWLLLLLIGYLVVIGPLDQYWLKKINRQMLTWLTFPAYVAGFSLLIYFIGYKLRAGEIEYNELHLVDVIAEKAELRGRTFASVYSPANARYQLSSVHEFASLRGESQRGQEASKAVIDQRPNGFDAQIAVPVWTSQLYVQDWLRGNENPLSISVSYDQLHWYLQINNRMDKRITAGKLVVSGRVIPVPVVPPNQSSRFTLSRTDGSVLANYVQNHSGNFQTIANQRQRAFGDQQRFFDLTNAVVAASFLSQSENQQRVMNPLSYFESGGRFVTMPGLDLSPLIQNGDAVFLGWVQDYSIVKPMNKFTPRRHHRDTVLRIATTINPVKAEN